MSKILLVAVNSSFSHTNIAVRYLKYFGEVSKLGAGAGVQSDVDFCEFTINQPLGEIIRGINSQNPHIILFSTYIWNVEAVVRIAKNIKALRPELIVAAGGPEAGFRGKDFLSENPDFDFVIKGEGEETFRQIVRKFDEISALNADDFRGAFLGTLKNVKGLIIKNPENNSENNSDNAEQFLFTGEQELICDMGTIPFPYPDLEQMDVDHKIFYYESSRGCPFSCAYCMSSLDTKVRFVPLEKVYADLQRFLDAGVKLVKFVDRTYNLKPERYIGIWKYIMEHHNGKTMFHFEIEGEFLSEEAMEFLQTVPEGIMQFEIGVQSSNPVVLKACGRSPETDKLRRNILRIPKTIHTHLDLIAGLPFENLESFGRSFDFVMNMKPDALQLGFLKVLYGAPVNSFCGAEPGWKWMKTPPYEVLETPYLTYDEILFLKDLETTLDAYWNDHHFDTVMQYLSAVLVYGQVSTGIVGDATAHNKVQDLSQCGESLTGVSDLPQGAAWWKLFVSFTKWLRIKDAFSSAHQKDYWVQMLHEYLEAADAPHEKVLSSQQSVVAQELLRFDYIAGGKKTNPPAWLQRNYDDQGHYEALQKTTGIKHSRLDFVYSDFDTFLVNPLDPATWYGMLPAAEDACTDVTAFAPHDKAPSLQQCEVSTGAEDACTDSTNYKSEALTVGLNAGKFSPVSTGVVASAASPVPYAILFLYARKESDRPTDFQRISHQILVKR